MKQALLLSLFSSLTLSHFAHLSDDMDNVLSAKLLENQIIPQPYPAYAVCQMTSPNHLYSISGTIKFA